jgi:hypothetical protein
LGDPIKKEKEYKDISSILKNKILEKHISEAKKLIEKESKYLPENEEKK